MAAAAEGPAAPLPADQVYHSRGWCRELWLASLGMPAVLPPPEEEKDVKSALEAAQAAQEREEMA